ncbi:caspase-8 [Polymixia lowei]
MDFQKLLLQVGQALHSDQIHALAFLCTDILDQDLSSVRYASDLFSLLMHQDVLSGEQPYLLADLLSTIGCKHLIRKYNLSSQISTTRSLISPYRKLLYDLSEDITEDGLGQIKFMLMEKLPRKKLEDHVTTLELFLELEHKDLLSNTNLNLLENMIQLVCPVLNRKIQNFKDLNVSSLNPVTQETRADFLRPRSASDLSLSNQTPALHPERPASCEVPGFDESRSSNQLLTPSYFEKAAQASNTSLDFARVSSSGDEGLSQRLSVLSTKTRNCIAVKETNVETPSSPENQTSENSTIGTAHFQTRNTKEEGLGTYPMTGPKRGICLIINNYDFDNSIKLLSNRHGTDFDERSLVSVFEWLGFETQIVHDCTRDQVLSVVQELRRKDHSQMDCLACCVLSHGQEGGVYGVDGQAVQLRELTEPFGGSQCPSLTEKPKLFFIQACQGSREQQAVSIQADGPAPRSVCTDAVVLRDTIPSDADFLMSMATVPHFASFRDRNVGTWFIQSLCQNLVQMVPSGHDLVSILTKVNDDVSKKAVTNGERKQMPQPAFSLRKRVVFPIPKGPAPSLH